ncbi:MAG: YbaB/EbfC family nucleoid-associated protein [Ornithinibacter sp.]
MDMDTERLYEAREEMDRRQQRLEAIPPRTQEIEAQDAGGVVRVRVGADGVVRSLVVDHRWQDSTAPSALADTIAAAFAAAGAEHLGSWIGDVEDAFALPEPQTRPMPVSVEDVRSAIPGSASLTEEELMSRIAALWAEVETEMDGALSDIEERTTRVHRVSSPDGNVHVEVTASGGLAHLELRESWLRSTHPANIGRSVLAVIEQAQTRAVASFAATRSDADASIARLTDLGNPASMARRVGLDS